MAKVLFEQLQVQKAENRIPTLPQVTRDTLKMLYHEENVTLVELAELFNVTPEEVEVKLKEFMLTDRFKHLEKHATYRG